MDTTTAAGGGKKRQKILAVHRTSQSQEGAYAGEAHPPETLLGGRCPGNRAGTVPGRLCREGCLLRAESEDRLYSVCGRLDLWTGLALFNQNFFFFFF